MGTLLKVVENKATPAVSLTVMQQVLQQQKSRSQELLNAPNSVHKQRLKRFHLALKKHQQALSQAVALDLKAHPAEIAVVEWAPIFKALSEAQQLTKAWRQPARLSGWLQSKLHIRHLGRGNCLLLCAWQQPLAQPLIHCIAALAAGNTVVLKPSNKTPHTALALAQLAENDLDPADFAVFLGDANVGQSLLSLNFDYCHVSGGSSATQHIQGQWRDSPDTLHLQTLRPVIGIVDTSADPEQAATHIAWSRYRYSGQTDSGPHVLFVHEGLRHRFISELKHAGEHLYGQTLGRQRYNKAYARMRDAEQFESVQKLFIDSRDHGAKNTIGGHFFQRDYFMSPTVLVDVLDTANIVTAACSAPILPVLFYASEQRLQALLDRLGHVHSINVYTRNPDALMQQVGNHSDTLLLNPARSQTCNNLIADMPSLLARFSLQQPIQPRQKQWFETLRPPWQPKKLHDLQQWIKRLSR